MRCEGRLDRSSRSGGHSSTSWATGIGSGSVRGRPSSRWTSSPVLHSEHLFSPAGRRIDPSTGWNLGFAAEQRPGFNRREASSLQPASTHADERAPRRWPTRTSSTTGTIRRRIIERVSEERVVALCTRPANRAMMRSAWSKGHFGLASVTARAMR